MYIHCHSCPWEQDDFWTSSYNPFTVLMSDIKWLWFPKMVRTEKKEFSWVVLARCIYWRLSAPFTQKWWTHASWKKAIAANGGKWPACPKCGEHNLDTD
jgi:hypothetical protein